MDPRHSQRSAPSPGRGRQAPRRATAAAVLGSVAALGGASGAVAQTARAGGPDRQPRQSRRVDPLPAGERALLGRVFSALSARAPSIAAPVLGQGVADGTITQAQEDHFLARLASAGGVDGAQPGRSVAQPPGLAAREVFQRAVAAIRAELPAIAAPMVSAAVADGSITPAEAARLSDRLSRGPRLGFGLVMRNALAAGTTRLP